MNTQIEETETYHKEIFLSTLQKQKQIQKIVSASKFGLPLPLPPNIEDENRGKSGRSERSKIDEKRHHEANQ